MPRNNQRWQHSASKMGTGNSLVACIFSAQWVVPEQPSMGGLSRTQNGNRHSSLQHNPCSILTPRSLQVLKLWDYGLAKSRMKIKFGGNVVRLWRKKVVLSHFTLCLTHQHYLLMQCQENDPRLHGSWLE